MRFRQSTAPVTKLAMARVVAAAVLNLEELPADDHHRVVRLAKKKKADLEPMYQQALKILQNR